MNFKERVMYVLPIENVLILIEYKIHLLIVIKSGCRNCWREI